jgi:hypothetical protein
MAAENSSISCLNSQKVDVSSTHTRSFRIQSGGFRNQEYVGTTPHFLQVLSMFLKINNETDPDTET